MKVKWYHIVLWSFLCMVIGVMTVYYADNPTDDSDESGVVEVMARDYQRLVEQNIALRNKDWRYHYHCPDCGRDIIFHCYEDWRKCATEECAYCVGKRSAVHEGEIMSGGEAEPEKVWASEEERMILETKPEPVQKAIRTEHDFLFKCPWCSKWADWQATVRKWQICPNCNNLYTFTAHNGTWYIEKVILQEQHSKSYSTERITP